MKIEAKDNKKTSNGYFFSVFFLITFYCCIRIYRNSINNSISQIGGIWNIITLLFVGLAICIISGLISKRHPFPKAFKYALFYSFFAQINTIINFKSFTLMNIYYFFMIPYFICITIVFFVISQEKTSEFNKKSAIIFYYIILFTTTYALFKFKTVVSGDVMVSDTYYPLCFFPFVLMWNKPKTLFIPISLMSICLMFSGKRAGIIAFVLAILTYYLVVALQERRLRTFVKTILSVFIIGTVIYTIYSYLNNIYYFNVIERILNLTVDKGSTRDYIYNTVWNGIKESNILELMFGHGDKTVPDLFMNSNILAHNDFLEILYDYGIVPFILFVAFYLSLIRELFFMMKVNYTYSGAFAASIVVALFISLFSYFAITFSFITCIAAFWGVLFSDWCIYREANKLLLDYRNSNKYKLKRINSND